MIFKCFKIYVQRNIFNDFFQCLFKKYVQRSFEIYVFYVHSKGFSIICFLKYICKRSQEICTNFKVKKKFSNFFFQKYVQSVFL